MQFLWRREKRLQSPGASIAQEQSQDVVFFEREPGENDGCPMNHQLSSWGLGVGVFGEGEERAMNPVGVE